MEEKQNLIARTINHLKTKLSNTKICKRIAALSLATAMTVGISFTAGCNKDNPTPDSSGSYSTSVPGDNQKYSALLRSVLTDKNNQALVKEFMADDGSKYSSLGYSSKEDYYENHYYYRLNSFPYAFLKKKGYDVDKIKSGEEYCRTSSFFLGKDTNKLYMMVCVDTDNYLISYSLTKQEAEEYRKLHEEKSIYANFMNNAISAQKQEKIEMHCSKCCFAPVNAYFYEIIDKSSIWIDELNGFLNPSHDSMLVSVDRKYPKELSTWDAIVITDPVAVVFAKFKFKFSYKDSYILFKDEAYSNCPDDEKNMLVSFDGVGLELASKDVEVVDLYRFYNTILAYERKKEEAKFNDKCLSTDYYNEFLESENKI